MFHSLERLQQAYREKMSRKVALHKQSAAAAVVVVAAAAVHPGTMMTYRPV